MSLKLKFFLTSLLSIAIIVIGLGSLVSTSVSAYLLDHGKASTAFYMTTFLEPNVQSMAGGGALSAADRAALDTVMTNPTLRRHVRSIKIWDTTGTIVHATNGDLVGQNFGTDDLTLPLAGQTTAYFDNLSDEENVFERELDRPIFEIYVPLRSRADGSIIAVGEFYEDATRMRSELYKLLRVDWFVLTLCGLAIFAGLFSVFRQGSRTIDAQKAAIAQIQKEREDLQVDTIRLRAGLDSARSQLEEMDKEVSRRIGQELHDGPVQMLGYLSLALDNLAGVSSRGSDRSDDVDEMQAATDRIQIELRQISNRLLASGRGKPAALADIVTAYARRSGAVVATEGLQLTDLLRLPAQRGVARIVEEALNNGFRHAGGHGQAVTAALSDGRLVIEITDDGPGLPPEETLATLAEANHHGISGMRDQARRIGARLDFDSPPEGGCRVRISVPVL